MIRQFVVDPLVQQLLSGMSSKYLVNIVLNTNFVSSESQSFIVSTTNTSTTVTSSGLFNPSMVGQAIAGPGIPAGTVISTFVSSSSVVISQAAGSGAGSGYATVTGPAAPTLPSNPGSTRKLLIFDKGTLGEEATPILYYNCFLKDLSDSTEQQITFLRNS